MKFNEEAVISDPELISKYNNVQSQVIVKQQQINNLQQQINKLNIDITNLEKAKGTIVQAQAQKQKQVDSQKQQQAAQQVAQAAQQASQAAAAPTDATATESQRYPEILVDATLLMEDDEVRFSPGFSTRSKKNWYQRPVVDPNAPRAKPHTWYKKRENEIQKWEEEIEILHGEIVLIYDDIRPPHYEGIEGEIENFFGELGFESAEVLNTGTYKTDAEKIEALKKAGVADPKGTLENFYYYYPEFDPSLEKQRKEVEKEAAKVQAKIEKLEQKIKAKELEIKHGGNPAVSESFYDLNETYVDVDLEKKTPEGYAEKPYVFHLRVIEDGEEFIGKVFKDSPDEDWFGVVKVGDSKTFKKMSYQPEWNELDIVEYLAEIYDEVEIIEEDEFEDEVIAEFEPPLESY